MNKVFLVELSVIFEMEEMIRYKYLVWANSKEEAKEKLLKDKERSVLNADGVIATIKVVECPPQNGIFHLGTY